MGNGFNRWWNHDTHIKEGGATMMYGDPGEQLDEMSRFFSGDKPYKMAVVDNVTGGRPYIRFYGEIAASQKPYKYLQSYTPIVGDKVLVARVAKTYVILGKVV